MNQPILDRPMFQGIAPTVSPMGSPMGGVGSITTPDQNATALRNMFAPQPSAQPAPQGYRRGGEIINGVAHFAGGNEVVAPPPPPAQEDPETARILEGGNPRPPQGTVRTAEDARREEEAARILAGGNPRPPSDTAKMMEDRRRAEQDAAETQRILEGGNPQGNPALRRAGAQVIATPPMASPLAAPPAAPPPAAPPPAAGIPSLGTSPGGMSLTEEMASVPGFNRVTRPPALPPVPDGTELQLQSIKARREQSEKDREQNKWMGILSAGLGMMASKDPRGIVGIGTGAQQGLATYQAAEKGRREDEATRRHEDIQRQQLAQQKQISDAQLAQQKTLTMAQIEKDPDNVRLFRALGGGDLQKGLNMYQADGKLQAAKAIMDNFMSTAEAKRDAEAYIRSALQRSGTAASGGAPGAPPPGSPVVSASDFVAGKK